MVLRGIAVVMVATVAVVIPVGIAVRTVAPVVGTAVIIQMITHPIVVIMVGATLVPAPASIAAPAVTTTVGLIDVRTAKIEVRRIVVASVDAIDPFTACEIDGAIEILKGQITFILIRRKHETQVLVAAVPCPAIRVEIIDTGQVVHIDLKDSIILHRREIQLIGHLVGQEQSLGAGCAERNSVCLECENKHCEQAENILFHSRYVKGLNILFSFSRRQRYKKFYIVPNKTSLNINRFFPNNSWGNPRIRHLTFFLCIFIVHGAIVNYFE